MQQRPQRATEVRVPLINFKKLLEERLAFGDCAEYVAKLISKAAELTKGKNDAIATDVMTLYKMINRQDRGGFRLGVMARDLPEWLRKVAGGSGLAYGNILHGTATAIIFSKGGYSDNPASISRIPYDYAMSGVHEIIHLAGKNGTYDEPLLTQAANALEPGKNYSDWDVALKEHCLPPNLR
jgi:hypothetical protein